MGEVVGAGPARARPDDHAAGGRRGGSSTRARTSPSSRACSGCGARSSRPSTTTPSSSSTRTGPRPSSSSSPRRTAAPGLFTSEELPRGMCRIPYDYRGDPELAHAMAAAGADSTAPGSPRSTTRTCRSSTPRSTSGSTSARAARQALGVDRRLPDRRHRGQPARWAGRSATRSPPTDRKVLLHRLRRAVAHVLAAARAARPRGAATSSTSSRRRPRDADLERHRLVRGRRPRAGARRRCRSSTRSGPRRGSATT